MTFFYDHLLRERAFLSPHVEWVLRCIRPGRPPIHTLFPFDTETFLIQPGQLAPKLVCLSSLIVRYGSLDLSPQVLHANFDRVALYTLVKAALLDRGVLLIGQNVSFDLCVLANEFPDLLPLIFAALDDDRVVCTELAERLTHIATNRLGGEYLPGGAHGPGGWVKYKYSLAELAKRHLGLDLDKDTWRLRYGTLWDVPVEQWDPGAFEYSAGDSVVAGAIFECICGGAERSYLHQPERVGAEQILIDIFRQTRAQFWIALMAARGFRVDPQNVATLKNLIENERNATLARLIEAGLVRPNGERDTKTAAAYMTAVCMMQNRPVKMTTGGASGEPKVALDEDVCTDTKDPLLIDYASYTSLTNILSKDIGALEEPAELGLPIQARFETLVETGRLSSSGGKWKGEGKPSSYTYQMHNVRKKLDIDRLEKLDPKIDERIGVRQCFVPRPGFYLLSVDYSMFELHSWAQVSIYLGVPLTKLANALNAGRDIHLELGARLVGTTYEDAKTRKKNTDVSEARQMAKCFHPDTQVLTRTGWVRISELRPDQEVMTASVRDGYAVPMQWEVPLRLTQREFTGNLVHLKNEGINLRVTPDHRMAGWAQGKHARAVQVSPDVLGGVRYWPNAGWYGGGSRIENEWWLRLAVAVQADGSYRRGGGGVTFGFVKNRKKDRIRWLLSQCGIEWTEKDRKSYPGCVDFQFRDEVSVKRVQALLDPDKTFPWWWLDLSPHLADLVIDEARFWDGTSTGKQTQYQFCSYIDKNLEVLQALASIRGRKTRQGEKHKVSVKLRAKSRGNHLSIEDVPYDGMVYCLTVSSDAVLVRDGGVPVITHQCANFGYPGGLGWRGFMGYAKAQYRLIFTEKEAKDIKYAWRESWEPDAYFRLISDLAGPANQAELIHPISYRRRAWASYTEAANGFFQSLAADAKKAAGWELTKKMYLPGTPLYGSRMVDEIHDEFLIEVPIDYAHEASFCAADTMMEVAKRWMPDCPPRVEPALMLAWAKAAEPKYDENKRLIPWRPT